MANLTGIDNPLEAPHPCFNPEARFEHARIHLPVAKRCNIQCRFCNRRYDCASESRPGVTARMLAPAAAAGLVDQVVARLPHVTVVGISGPGDPLANPDETFRTLALIRDRHPHMILCVGTNGLRGAEFAGDLVAHGVSFVSVTINAATPETGGQVYAWALDGRTALRGAEGGAHLLERQLAAVQRLAELGVTVKVNTVLIPGINDHEILPLARRVKDLGAAMINVMPLIPVAGAEFEHRPAPEPGQLALLRRACEAVLPSMNHCAQCRSDAIGLLGQDRSAEFADPIPAAAPYLAEGCGI